MADFAPRRAPDPTFRAEWRDESGVSHTLKADDDGVVHPTSQGEKRAADAFALPVARKAQAEQKSGKEA